jgi:hypothetical protein
MRDLVRTTLSGLAGGLVVAGLLGGPAAVAEVKAQAKKVTSAQIQNGTIRRADLNTDVNASLTRADTALQGIRDGSVVTTKLADGSVTGAKLGSGSVSGATLAADSVTTDKIAPETITRQDLAFDSVSWQNVKNGSLALGDVSSKTGVADVDFPNITPGNCAASAPILDAVDALQAIILVENDPLVAGSIYLMGRKTGFHDFQILACNTGTVAFNPQAANIAWAVFNV